MAPRGGSYGAGVGEVVVSGQRVRRLRARLPLQVLDLCRVGARAERGALLEEVRHVADLRERKAGGREEGGRERGKEEGGKDRGRE